MDSRCWRERERESTVLAFQEATLITIPSNCNLQTDIPTPLGDFLNAKPQSITKFGPNPQPPKINKQKPTLDCPWPWRPHPKMLLLDMSPPPCPLWKLCPSPKPTCTDFREPAPILELFHSWKFTMLSGSLSLSTASSSGAVNIHNSFVLSTFFFHWLLWTQVAVGIIPRNNEDTIWSVPIPEQ